MIDVQTATLDTRPVVQPMVGRPDQARVLRCFYCLGEIGDGDTWERLTPADGSYSIAVHTVCRYGEK